LTDPPYGIRAGARKSGSKKEVVKDVPPEHLHNHIPATQPYEAADVMGDLLQNAARLLKVGGRLVYWLPCTYDFDEAMDMPLHPCLEGRGEG
jgi:tRNA (guanine10-N2)-methyltransferase